MRSARRFPATGFRPRLAWAFLVVALVSGCGGSSERQTTPAASIESRQLMAVVQPIATNAPNTSGMTSCVTPPPMLPQPAVVALAVPTTLGANIVDV